MTLYLKDPQARIDYGVDWAPGYLDGQVIAASTWCVDPVETGGIAVEAESFELVRTAAVLSGGVAGHVYRVGNRITLSDGRSDERSLVIRVEQR